MDDVDYTAAEALRELHETLSCQGIRLVFASVMSGTCANAPAQIRALFGDKVLYTDLGALVADAQQEEVRGARSAQPPRQN